MTATDPFHALRAALLLRNTAPQLLAALDSAHNDLANRDALAIQAHRRAEKAEALAKTLQAERDEARAEVGRYRKALDDLVLCVESGGDEWIESLQREERENVKLAMDNARAALRGEGERKL